MQRNMDDELARDIIARHFVASTAFDNIGDAWGLYPELDEADWNDIQDRVEALVRDIGPADTPFAYAYSFLVKRANRSNNEG